MNAKAILRYVLTRFSGVCVVMLLLEAAFRFGLWEPMARGYSNAGMAIRVKESVKALGPEKINFITVGDSRAVYGIDHERVAALAKSKGFTHINAAVPGMHWMSTGLMMRWLKEQSPNLKGAIIATNISNFSYNGNGYYELGLATPFASIRDVGWMKLHVPFEQKTLATYGSYSALFQYREDIADFMKNPVARIKNISRNQQSYGGGAPLFQTERVTTNTCAVPTNSIKSCMATPITDANAGLVASCKSLKPQSENQLDFREFDNPNKWPHLAEVRKIRQAQLRSSGLPKPTLVLLMPIPKVGRDELLPKGSEEWALSILQPLADEGVIELHNYTHFFDLPDGAECGAFWDLYHQNAEGQRRLTDEILPIIEKHFYQPTKQT